jgi:hypothetical protein
VGTGGHIRGGCVVGVRHADLTAVQISKPIRRVPRTWEKIGDESAERTLRDVVLGGHAWSLDDAFLNPSNTDGPGALTLGGTAVTSTGSSAAQITTDLGSMIAGITTRGNGLVWILRPTTLARVGLALGGGRV